MKGLSQTVLFMIVLVLLARTAVNSFNPSFDRFGVLTCTSPSDWAEEPVGEDEPGEEDNAMSEIPSWGKHGLKPVSPKTVHVFALLNHIPEIFVPPPQA